MKKLLLLLTLIAFYHNGFSQTFEESDYFIFSQNNQFHARAMYDAGELMWLGTQSGLVKFDKSTGSSTTYNGVTPNVPTLGTMPELIYSINRIFAFSEEQLLLGTEHQGYVLFHLEEETWEHFTADNSGLPYNGISSIYKDEADSFWFLGWNTISKFDGTGWSYIDVPEALLMQTDDQPGFFDLFTDLVVNSDTDIWLSSRYGAYHFDGTDWTDYTGDINRQWVWFNTIYEDTEGHIWISDVEESLTLQFDGSTWIEHNISAYAFQQAADGTLYANGELGFAKWISGTSWESIWPNDIKSLHIAPDETFWFTKNLGQLFHLPAVPGMTDFVLANHEVYDMIDRPITDFTQDNEGNVWVCQGHVLSMYDGESWLLDGLPSPVVAEKNLRINNPNDIWVYSHDWADRLRLHHYDGGFLWTTYDYTNSPLANASDSYTTQNGNHDDFWFMGNGHILNFDGTDWITFDSTNSPLQAERRYELVLHPETDEMWLGESMWDWLAPTEAIRLLHYDGENWEVWDTETSDIPDNAYEIITSMELNPNNNNIWIGSIYYPEPDGTGTAIGNIIQFDGTDFTTYADTIQDIPVEPIIDIHIDAHDLVWVGTRLGVFYYDGTGWQHHHLADMSAYTGKVLSIEEQNSEVYIHTVSNGLYTYDHDTDTWANYLYSPSPSVQVAGVLADTHNDFLWTRHTLNHTDLPLRIVQHDFEEDIVDGVEGQDLWSEVDNQHNLVIAPNPVRHSTVVQLSENDLTETVQVQLYDINGKLVLRHAVDCYDGRFVLNCSGLMAGRYICRVLTENKVVYGGALVVE